MTSKILPLLLGVSAGYLLGTRAGREKYDALKRRVDIVWENPRVAAARHDVESYTREQAPIIRERAEAAAKAAPGVVADAAKDVASKTSEVAKDVANKTTEVARDAASKTAEVAKDVAAKTSEAVRDVADKTSTAAKDVAGKARRATGTATTRVLTSAGKARDDALEDSNDDDNVPRPAGF